jgi:hypothetical protein
MRMKQTSVGRMRMKQTSGGLNLLLVGGSGGGAIPRLAGTAGRNEMTTLLPGQPKPSPPWPITSNSTRDFPTAAAAATAVAASHPRSTATPCAGDGSFYRLPVVREKEWLLLPRERCGGGTHRRVQPPAATVAPAAPSCKPPRVSS